VTERAKQRGERQQVEIAFATFKREFRLGETSVGLATRIAARNTHQGTPMLRSTQCEGNPGVMIDRIKKSWSLFWSSQPGWRFRERYRLNKSRRRGRFDPVRWSYIIGGVMLVVMSTLFGWLPVLGWGTAFLGVGMIAGEIYPVARLMDRLEVRVRRLFKPRGKIFMRLPTWAQLSISLTIAVSTFTLVYGIYSLTFGS
jgi:hypothetical protein